MMSPALIFWPRLTIGFWLKQVSVVRAHELAQLVDVDVVLRVVLDACAGISPSLVIDDALGVDGGDDAAVLGDDDDLRVAGDALLDAGADERRLGLEERHALALHVRAHERAVGVVMLEEGDHAGGDRDHLLRARRPCSRPRRRSTSRNSPSLRTVTLPMKWPLSSISELAWAMTLASSWSAVR